MKKYNFGIVFSKEFKGSTPLGHIGSKLPVYLRLLKLCQREGWGVYVVTRKTYQRDGVFNGVWLFKSGKFQQIRKPIKIDILYDRSAGVKFPPEGEEKLKAVNIRSFKILCWDKWLAYKKFGKYMPKTVWVGDYKKNVKKVLPEIKTNFVVLKPFNGLKGLGIYIGLKEKALEFSPSEKYSQYIAQEFVDTVKGIKEICDGRHDIRVAIINAKPVWCHVRIPAEGSLKANVAGGGTLKEIDYKNLPSSLQKIVEEISKKFAKEYDNPVYSIDFGIDKDGTPKIFELNDQIGFPKWEMKNRDTFLLELVSNFKEKLNDGKS
jgi:glutathione synthase/RimK-type ligase-like ATP-grasp enzyme